MPDEDVFHALESAYRDGSWGKYHGLYVERLEKQLAQYHDLEFAATCGSGTFAVELALRALKIGPGDEVILAAYDYGGNFLSVHAVGAMPVLVDVDPENWNLNPDVLREAIGAKTRAVIVSHLHGGLVPMREVMGIAADRGLHVIEDAAQAPGAVVQGRKAGTWGDVGILSFGGSKLLTAGRGGAFLTRHADIFQRARLWLHRGNHVCPLSELQAAVLVPQLDKLDERNQQRAFNVRFLSEKLNQAGIPLRPFVNRTILAHASGWCADPTETLTRSVSEAPARRADSQPGYYKLGFQYNPADFKGLPRERFLAAMHAEGIAFDEGFQALHVGRSPSRFRPVGPLVEADKANDGAVVLHHPVLLGASTDIEQLVYALSKIHFHADLLTGKI
jgi:dTDP-4-amino-4,6-dideoxygalactose transaminase